MGSSVDGDDLSLNALQVRSVFIYQPFVINEILDPLSKDVVRAYVVAVVTS